MLLFLQTVLLWSFCRRSSPHWARIWVMFNVKIDVSLLVVLSWKKIEQFRAARIMLIVVYRCVPQAPVDSSVRITTWIATARSDNPAMCSASIWACSAELRRLTPQSVSVENRRWSLYQIQHLCSLLHQQNWSASKWIYSLDTTKSDGSYSVW